MIDGNLHSRDKCNLSIFPCLMVVLSQVMSLIHLSHQFVPHDQNTFMHGPWNVALLRMFLLAANKSSKFTGVRNVCVLEDLYSKTNSSLDVGKTFPTP
jgi:hypothetical protein